MTEYNKVVYGGQTLIDLTQDDVTASDVRSGVYFHSADGVRSQGTLQIVDYIVEQGTDNGWTYRKWNSGIAECWKLISNGSTAMTSAEGSGYYAPKKTYSFPSIFTAITSVSADADLHGALGGFTISVITVSSFSGYLWATRSITKETWVNAHVVGTWK